LVKFGLVSTYPTAEKLFGNSIERKKAAATNKVHKFDLPPFDVLMGIDVLDPNVLNKYLNNNHK